MNPGFGSVVGFFVSSFRFGALGALSAVCLAGAAGVFEESAAGRGAESLQVAPTTAPAGTVLMGMGTSEGFALGDRYTGSETSAVSVATGVSSIGAGADHTLFIKSGGTLWGAGQNAFGQLGDGTRLHRATPVQIATGVVSAAGGLEHSVFVKSDGTVWATGSNSFRQLGDGTTTARTTPVQVATGGVAVAAGWYHNLLLKSDGSLWVWGYGGYGQLGTGSNVSQATPVQIATGVSAVAACTYFSAFVKTDGTLWTMGDNSNGQLGDGSTTDRSTPVQVGASVAKVALGNVHTLFVKADGTLWATGSNFSGQLMDGTTVDKSTPVQVASGVGAAIGGGNSSAYIKTDGTVWGRGAIYGSATTTQFATNGAALAAGFSHTVVLKTDGTLWAIGSNNYGQIGNGQMAATASPVAVASEVGAVFAAATRTQFVKQDRSFWSNRFTATGSILSYDFPANPTSSTVVASAAQSSTHSLFRKADGSLWSVGSNSSGQLCDGTTTTRSAPVATGLQVKSVAAGSGVSWIVKSDDTLWSVGTNTYGQLGDGTKTNRSALAQVATGVRFVAGCDYRAFFIKSDGTLWAMGRNGSGELGDGSTTDRTTPVQVATAVATVVCGDFHTAFVKTDGSLWTMGRNISGGLGDGTTTTRTAPVMVASGVTAAAAGRDFTLFVKSDFSLWAMGENLFGQLGDGSYSNRSSPVPVATGVLDVAAGDYHSLFLQVPSGTTVTTQPTARSIGGGQTTTLSVGGSGTGALTYQWYRGVKGDTSDPVIGATGATLTTPALTTSQTYWARVTGAGGSADSDAANVSVTSGRTIPTAPAGGKLVGISTRAFVGSGFDGLVGGLATSGGTTRILARVSGPLLAKYGVGNALLAPRLQVIPLGASVLAENSGWDTSADAAQIATLVTQIGLAPFDAGSRDAALLLNLPPGAYTFQVEGTGGGSGVALLEIYRVEAGSTGRLVGLSSRARVGTGNDVLIAGFAVEGDTQVLLRAGGPKLLEYGITSALSDPDLEIYSGTTLMDRATDWSANYTAAQISPIFARLGQQPFTVGSKDSAAIATIRGGNRTAMIKGNNDGTGVAIAEIYLVEP